MDEYLEFYSKIYERELERSKSLSEKMNVPITLIGLFVSLMYYTLSKVIPVIPKSERVFLIIGLVVSFVLIIIAVIYLALSFNKLFSGYTYPDLPKTTDLRKYQLELDDFNKKAKSEKKEFSVYLIEKYANYSDKFSEINDYRAKCLSNSKKLIVGTLFVQVIIMTIFLFTNLF